MRKLKLNRVWYAGKQNQYLQQCVHLNYLPTQKHLFNKNNFAPDEYFLLKFITKSLKPCLFVFLVYRKEDGELVDWDLFEEIANIPGF